MPSHNLLLQSIGVGLVLLSNAVAAPVSSAPSMHVSALAIPVSAPISASASTSKGFILLDWKTAPQSTSLQVKAAGVSPPSATSVSISSGYIATSITSSISSSPTSSIPSTASTQMALMADMTPTKSHWALPPQFSNMDPFSVTSYAAGEQNLAVLRGSPAKWTDPSAANTTSNGPTGIETWDMDKNALQILYPNGSINPGNRPQGGAEFYGQPLDLRVAMNTTLQYSVYFPHGFAFVKGGKLPGLYGGHKGCSGGNAAEDCFSTRIMWREGGLGELYLYVPKDKQTPSLCSTPPQSYCDSEYGLSIGRGAWSFPQGDWTTIRQDIWLNTPGVNDGGFNIWINGQLVMTASDVRYRENAVSCGDKTAMTGAGADDPTNEDWSSVDAEDVGVDDVTSSFSGQSTSTALPSAISATISRSFTTATASMSSTLLVNGLASSASLSSLVSLPSMPSHSSYSFYNAHPRFHTPMQRWLNHKGRDGVQSAPSRAIKTTKTILGSILPSTSVISLPTAIASVSSMAKPSDIKLKQVNNTTDATSQFDDPSAAPLLAQSSTDDIDSEAASPATCGVGFIGLFFSTFFGGHTHDWATPKDQYTYYRDFEMWVNN